MDKKVVRVLLIEDNYADAQLISEILENEKKVKFELIHVNKFFNSLNDLDESNIDIILLDLSLPDIQGLDTLKQANIALPETPIIVLTGKEGNQIGLKAIRLGAQDYLVKENKIRYLLVHSILYAIERKKFEEELNLSKLQYKSVFDNIIEGILQFDHQNKIINANSAIINMLGYSSVEELLEIEPSSGIFQQSDELDNILNSLQETEKIENIPVNWKKKDGSIIQVQLHSLTKNTVRDQYYFEIIVENITHQKNLEMEIQQSLKLDSLGNIAGGISHDLNNLLMAINMNLYLIENKLPAGHSALENLHETNAVVKQASELTGKILTFSRKKPLESKYYNLKTIITDFSKTMKRIIEANIDINFIFDHKIDSVKCDRTQIERVLLNLFVNARDAMPNGGILTLSTYNIYLEENQVHPNVKSGEYICMEIRDTGNGIPQEAQAKIFEPYFTTKESGKGTGMGLSVVYGIVQSHRGFINFSSNHNGTVFKVFLPIIDISQDKIDHSSMEIRDNAPVTKLENDTITILLIEDNQNIQVSITKFLKSKNFKVYSVSDGLEALKIFAEKHEGIDLIFTDLVLPKKGGLELYHEIIGQYPRMKFLFTSGYSSPPQETIDFINENHLSYIQKPYIPESLIQKIHTIINN
jgi:two-component system cell cycle sensor histidine kinase/response regulator CckA